MIAGIELFALGVEQVVGHVDEPLEAGGVGRAVRRRRAVPARARRVQAAQRRHARPPAPGRGGAVRGVPCRSPRRSNALAALAARDRDLVGADRLRGDPLPRVARPGTAGGMTDPGGGYGWRSGRHLPRRRGGVFGWAGPPRTSRPVPRGAAAVPAAAAGAARAVRAARARRGPADRAGRGRRRPAAAVVRAGAHGSSEAFADAIAAVQARRMRLPGYPARAGRLRPAPVPAGARRS